jgi:DnaJ family protein C protein 28
VDDSPTNNTGNARQLDDEWRPPPFKEWPANIEQLIEEAIRDGTFDDLPGRGRPLKLATNPFAGDAQLAYQLLKDNDYTLPWIGERKTTLAKIKRFRESIRRSWVRFREEYLAARDRSIRMSLRLRWRSLVAEREIELERLNGLIGATNLKQPGEKLEILKLTINDELKRAGAKRELD